MKLFGRIELIDLALYSDNMLVMSDFHIGYEEALNKQGIFVPRFQFREIMKRLEGVFSKLKGRKIESIVILGDLKHEFGTISDQEWRHTLQLLDYFSTKAKEVILIKGNHDTILGPIANKRNVKVVVHHANGKVLCLHGDKLPSKEQLKNVSTIITGHEHPAISIKDGARAELFKCFLAGKWKGKDLIVVPSFNLVAEGTDIMKEKKLSPFLKGDIGKFRAIVAADKMYDFGMLRNL